MLYDAGVPAFFILEGDSLYMNGRTIKRPNEEALQRVLEREKGTVSEVILRLAWQMGLSRDEIHHLQWQQVALPEMQVQLADRSIPMDAAVMTCLEHRATLYQKYSDYAVVSNRGTARLEPQSISRLARFALDAEESLKGISLKDLRHDFIIRQLAIHPWPYVARISGMASTTMYTMFSTYMREDSAADAQESAAPKKTGVQADEFFVWKIVQAEGPSPVGIALWMAWHYCMEVTEIISLTWPDVDVHNGVIHLEDREVVIDAMLQRWLRELLASRTPQDDPHVLLTPKSKRPFEASRISKATRTVLIRHGAEDMTFQDLVYAAKRNAVDVQLLKYLKEKGSITRGDVTELLQTTPTAAYTQLRRLADTGAIVRIGGKYYLPEAVVLPEQQYDAIRQYLKNYGVAYLQALADLLKIERRPCAWILRRFIEEGKLARRGQLYVLPEAVAASKSEAQQV